MLLYKFNPGEVICKWSLPIVKAIGKLCNKTRSRLLFDAQTRFAAADGILIPRLCIRPGKTCRVISCWNRRQLFITDTLKTYVAQCANWMISYFLLGDEPNKILCDFYCFWRARRSGFDRAYGKQSVQVRVRVLLKEIELQSTFKFVTKFCAVIRLLIGNLIILDTQVMQDGRHARQSK